MWTQEGIVDSQGIIIKDLFDVSTPLHTGTQGATG